MFCLWLYHPENTQFHLNMTSFLGFWNRQSYRENVNGSWNCYLHRTLPAESIAFSTFLRNIVALFPSHRPRSRFNRPGKVSIYIYIYIYSDFCHFHYHLSVSVGIFAMKDISEHFKMHFDWFNLGSILVKVICFAVGKKRDNDSLLGVDFSGKECGRKEWWLSERPPDP